MKTGKRIVCICCLILTTCMFLTGCENQTSHNRRSLMEKILNPERICASEEDLVKWFVAAVEDNDTDGICSLMNDELLSFMEGYYKHMYGLTIEEFYGQILDSVTEYMSENHRGIDTIEYEIEDRYMESYDFDVLIDEGEIDTEEICEEYEIDEKELSDLLKSFGSVSFEELYITLIFHGLDKKDIEAEIEIHNMIKDDIYYLLTIADFQMDDDDRTIEFDCVPTDDSVYGQRSKRAEDVSNAQTIATAVVAALSTEAGWDGCTKNVYSSDELYSEDNAFTSETAEYLKDKEHFYCKAGPNPGGEFTIYIDKEASILEIYGGPEVDDYYMVYPEASEYYR